MRSFLVQEVSKTNTRNPRCKLLLLLLLAVFLAYNNYRVIGPGRAGLEKNYSSSLPTTTTTTAPIPMPKHPPQRRLEFLHIPKTGGTVIEYSAARSGVRWSLCHFSKGTKAVQCPERPLQFPWPEQPKYHGCPWWHLPAQYFDLQPANPYHDADLFVVVRNVYDRIVSEYYYVATMLQRKTHSATNNVQAFNRFLTQRLESYHRRALAGQIDQNRTGNARYFANDGHDIPQYDFVYDSNRRRLVKHVLRFENLHAEFEALMELYNLTHILPLPFEWIRRRSHSKELGVYNMTRRNLELIERVYENDFQAFGYDIIPIKDIPKDEQLTMTSASSGH